MKLISYGAGETQIAGAVPFIAQFPGGDARVITFWDRGYASTKALLDKCDALGISALVQCEDWATNHAPDWARTASFIRDHAGRKAFAGFYFDEPGIKKPSSGYYGTHLIRYKSLLSFIHANTPKPTVAVFGLHSELMAGYSGLARVEGVDNYWNDPVPPSRDWQEYSGFVDALVAGHRRTGWQGEYVAVVAAYARSVPVWVSSRAEMRRTHDYLAGLVGDRLTWSMLWAADTGSSATRGYMIDGAALAEAKAHAEYVTAPPSPPAPDVVTVKLKPGQRLIVEVEK